ARQRLGGEEDLLGNLVWGEPLGAVRAEVLALKLDAGPRHDDRRHGLSPLRVGSAQDGRLEHARVSLEHGLHLDRRDVLAAADDRVRLAAGDVQVSVGVEASEVAGVEPAIRRKAAPGDGRALDEDLAGWRLGSASGDCLAWTAGESRAGGGE